MTALMAIGELEQALLREFPAEDAEEWDRVGLLVGDPAASVTGVAVALDPTVAAVREAHARGCNVLLTHHPVFLAAPDVFAPGESAADNAGAVVWAAIAQGVALMAFHTPLDVSAQAARVLPGLLGLDFTGTFVEPLAGSTTKGYGQICTVRAGNPNPAGEAAEAKETPFTLGDLAKRCAATFGRAPRVWGDPARELTTVATFTGSCGSAPAACVHKGISCIVCGEVKYHVALDASAAGLSIIDLGHDVSELPFVPVLAKAAENAGVASELIHTIDQSANWTTPEL